MENDKYFYYKKSRMSQLRSFCAVVQNNCVAVKAAEEINVEPATITKQLQSLEGDLDLVLFDRSEHKKLRLTKEGQLFYDEAVKHLNGINSLFDNFSGKLKEYNKMHLNIAIYETAAAYVLPKMIGEMLKIEEFKNIEILIYNLPKDEAIKKLINREVDLAFYITDLRDIIPPGIETLQSFKSSISLVFNKKHPLAKKEKITKKDIESYKFIERDMETENNYLAHSYFNIIPSNVKIAYATSEIITEVIRYTDNIAMIPEIYLKRNEAILNVDVAVRNIDHLFKDAFFNVMTLKNYRHKNSVLWLMEEFQKLSNKEI